MRKIIIELEFWADSFHEGDWACQNLLTIHQHAKRKVTYRYEKGFLPVYFFEYKNSIIKITVYGSYESWSPLPKSINELIKWGKPDLIIYDPSHEEIILAVEETAAVPTGNQALQRCERLFGSAQANIPFWYLLAEYGLHKDGSPRRDSIWPSIMAIKLTIQLRVPSIVLHYADIDNPEGYDFGTGVKVLFKAIHQVLVNISEEIDPFHNMHDLLQLHYEDVLRFINSQYKNMINFLPGEEHISNKEKRTELAGLLSSLALTNEEIYKENYLKKYKKFLIWPLLDEYNSRTTHESQASELLTYDALSEQLENSIINKKAYTLGSNSGSGQPQPKKRMEAWIKRQNELFLSYDKHIYPKANFNLSLNNFSKTTTGNYHITTSKNIVYLFDKFEDLKNILIHVFPRLKNKLDRYDAGKPTFVYVSNSLKPGRIFGDPYTGQLAAYGVAFGRYDIYQRYVIAYYPHQAFTQIFDVEKRSTLNKGYLMMREITDLMIFGGGVGIYFDRKDVNPKGKML